TTLRSVTCASDCCSILAAKVNWSGRSWLFDLRFFVVSFFLLLCISCILWFISLNSEESITTNHTKDTKKHENVSSGGACKMKKIFAAQIAILMICFAWVGVAGQDPSDIELEGDPLDVFGKLTNEDLAGRIDNLLVTLSNLPENYIAYAVFYPGENVPAESRQSTEKYLWQHINLRKFDASRVVVMHGELQPMEETEFWIASRDAKPPKLKGTEAELSDSLEGY